MQYELCFLGLDNKVMTTKLIESTDDASAFTTAQLQVNGQAIEVWRGSHFVATIGAASAALTMDDAHRMREHLRGILRHLTMRSKSPPDQESRAGQSLGG